MNDAVGELLGLINGYAYANGNPVNMTDPSGMQACPPVPGLDTIAPDLGTDDVQYPCNRVGMLSGWEIDLLILSAASEYR